MKRCLACGTDNADNAKFCIECAARLIQSCTACGTENIVTAKFCRQCAAPLGDGAAQLADGDDIRRRERPIPRQRVETESRERPLPGERRHLTVLMSDLVDSTRIAASLDPEEWREILTRCEHTVAEIVIRHGGYVARYLGDGLMVYFGYPEAHENDTERAVRAGLAIIGAFAALNKRLAAEQRPLLSVRIGIDAGSVVVGSIGGLESDVFGDVPNIAARLQALARPNSVVVTSAVQRLVSGLFVVEDRGAHELKGVARPMQVYEVVRPTGARGRVHAATAAHGLSRFVGREDELRSMCNRWERVQAGDGQVVMISGEAGIGKSRLVQHFRDTIAGTPHRWLECGGVPVPPSTPFDAVTELLKQTLGWQAATSPEQRREDLERALAAAGMELSEAFPLVAPLLNLPVPEIYPASLLPPEEQRRRLLATLARWVFAAAALRPLVIAIEDLQWVDASTIDFQQLLVEQGTSSPLLLIHTARPEFRAPWPVHAHHLHITLSRLSYRQVREMVTGVVVAKTLPFDVIEAMARRTDGVPLFVEELTALLLEGGADVAADAIPATLQDSLMARLDRLGSAKEIVQVGAVIGREFSYSLLRATLPLTDAELQAALTRATDAELLYARGVPPDASYRFKHVLVQDAAYQALLRSKRRELHGTIAGLLRDRFSDVSALHPELLAHHYAEAGAVEEAATAWQRAGDSAVARGALKEAENRFARAISLLDEAPPTAGLEKLKLVLQLAQGQVLLATRGYAAPEVQAAYARADALGERVGNPAQFIFTLMGRWITNLIRSELQAAQAVAAHIVAAAEGHGALRIWGQLASGITHYHTGDLAAAWAFLERAASLYEHEFFMAIPQDPGVPALGYGARTALQLGMTGTARARMQASIDLARRLEKPFDLASAYSYAAGICLLLGDIEKAYEYSGLLTTIASEYGMPFYAADALILRGRALVEHDSAEHGIDMMREGVRQQIANGQRVGLGYYLSLLSEAQIRIGALDAALASVGEALTAVPEERVDHPRLLHLRGAIHLQMAASDRSRAAHHLPVAEEGLREALSLADSIGAHLTGLRAATALAGLLRADGRDTEARNLLAPLCTRSSNDFDARALQEARTMLDTLQG
jgi:class 3 adenylate cyclase/tetratricopeptide (TPR) repeat protein